MLGVLALRNSKKGRKIQRGYPNFECMIERIENLGGKVSAKENDELSAAHGEFNLLRSYPLVSGRCTATERKMAWKYCQVIVSCIKVRI